ncbi:MAG: tetratricopeptide repeat protein [Phycisphaerales bacterium]
MSDAEHFDRIGALFAGAVERPESERSNWLDAACTDADVRAQVDALLDEHQRPSPLDANPVDSDDPSGGAAEAIAELFGGGDDPRDASDGATSGSVPATIGPYRVVRRIGHGGMGIVWEAVQTTPDRTVAVKVIRREITSPSVIARFEAERQMLALMDHPNVATVLGGGTTDGGRPYLAMEFVDGAPLLEYARNASLTVVERLNLFMDVCSAIQHAHQKGIIHRDIKPSNVLVTVRDGVAVPKVIDFGIAKISAENRNDATLTEHGQLVGTPAYMSPEQAGLGASHDVDTQSDIYALGVLLYEMLTGSPPLDTESDQSMAEVLRIIRDEQPVPPSARLTSIGSTDATRIRGDIDWIVMTCLEKERTRRYPSAAALADDIRRHLNDQTVTAGPPSLAYTLRKFVRRNRPQVIAAGVAALALSAGAIGTTANLMRALDAEAAAKLAATDALNAAAAESEARAAAQASAEEARASASAAESETLVAEETIDFLLDDVLGAADPTREGSRDLTVRDAVRTAGRELEGRFAERPDVELRVRNSVARTLERIGAVADAETHRLRELELLRELDPPDSRRHHWAAVTITTNMMRQGRLQEAVAMSREIVEQLRPIADPDEDVLLAALGNLGVGHLQLGQLDEAAPVLVETLAAKRRTLGDRAPSTLTGIHNLAGLQQQLGESELALELIREAHAGREEVFGPSDPRTLSSLNLMVHILAFLDRPQDAIAALEAGMRTADEQLGERHPTTQRLSRSLASLYHRGGDLPAAERLMRRSLQVLREDVGDENFNTMLTMKSLAVVVGTQGRGEEALALLEEALTVARKIWTPDSMDLADLLAHVSAELREADRFTDAEVLLIEAVEILTDGPALDGRAVHRVGRAVARLAEQWSAAEPDSDHGDRVLGLLPRIGIDVPPDTDPVQAVQLWQAGQRPNGAVPEPKPGG